MLPQNVRNMGRNLYEYVKMFSLAAEDLRKSIYVSAELPRLGFASGQFHLALCAHFLFTYTHLLTFTFHLESVREMVRVANEARIYPVFGLDGKQSGYSEGIIETLSKDNYIVQLQEVDCEIQERANQMLIVKAAGGGFDIKQTESHSSRFRPILFQDLFNRFILPETPIYGIRAPNDGSSFASGYNWTDLKRKKRSLQRITTIAITC